MSMTAQLIANAAASVALIAMLIAATVELFRANKSRRDARAEYLWMRKTHIILKPGDVLVLNHEPWRVVKADAATNSIETVQDEQSPYVH